MSNENSGQEYLKIIAQIIAMEMGLNTTSTDPQAQRVIIWHENYDLPKTEGLLIVLSEDPGKVIGLKTSFNDALPTPLEQQELVIAKTVDIDVMSRNFEARQHKEEVLMALASFYSQQQQEAAGFRIFAYPNSFLDISEAEGSSNIYRFRASMIVHVRYSKTKTVNYYNSFERNIIAN